MSGTAIVRVISARGDFAQPYFFLSTARAFISLLGELSWWMYLIHLLHYLLLFLFFTIYCPPLPLLVTRGVIARANAQLSRILRSLIFFWRISLVRGVILLLRFDAFNWFAAQEAVTQSIFFVLFILDFLMEKPRGQRDIWCKRWETCLKV